MFDANARHLKKGTLFFAERGGDLLYCEMLDKCHKNPKIKVITSHKNDDNYNGLTYKADITNYKWFFAIFAGYVDEKGELQSFINQDDKEKAVAILGRISKENRRELD